MRFSSFIASLIVLALSQYAFGQSLLYCQVEGELLPVAEVKGGRPFCFTGDSLVKGDLDSMVMSAEHSFGQGFIDVEVVKNERDGVIKQDGLLQFTSDRSWYLLICRLVSDRDLPNAYFSLKLDSYGDKSYYLGSLGDISAGEDKMLRVFVKLKYEMPDQLHIFSGMEEIRTSLVPSVYRYEHGELVFAAN